MQMKEMNKLLRITIYDSNTLDALAQVTFVAWAKALTHIVIDKFIFEIKKEVILMTERQTLDPHARIEELERKTSNKRWFDRSRAC